MSALPGPSRESRALVRVLAHAGITVVLDVGANTGQYAQRLRAAGWNGRIVSFEPLSGPHAALSAAAAGDPAWEVAPPVALGERDGTVTIQVSAESDMSSILPFRPEAAALLSSATCVGRQTVPLARLDRLFGRHVGADDRAFLKLDTQGYDGAVLDGAAGVLPRIHGLQVELALVPVYQGEPDWRAMIDRLETLGFAPVLFIPGYFHRRTARLMSMDGVFVRPPPA